MGSSSNHVKRLLATARMHHRPELLQDVMEELLATESNTGTTSTELRVLCSEVAVELQQWQIASQLLRGVGTSHESRLLRMRKVFCDVLVSLHEVETQPTLSEDEKVQQKLLGTATALRALADSVEMWPDSLDAVLIGIRTLWTIIRPLLDAGRQAEVCDAVAFLASLHQQLHIGGGYTLVQWMARSALCLYAADRYAEAFAHFTTAMEAAAFLSNQRLYVQLLRMAAGVISAREKAAAPVKGRTEFLGTYRSRPVIYAVLLTQLVLTGHVEVDTCREELHSTYETVHNGSAEVVLPAEAAGATTGKGRKKIPAAKQQAATTRVTEAFTITDPDVIEEVKSDLLLCIALHDTLTMAQQEELERRRNSPNRRVRSFTAFALIVQDARLRGLAQLNTCADASVLVAAHRCDVNAIIQKLLSVLKATNAIHDESERQYTLHMGVSLLWNYILPFLQPTFTGDVQASLEVILEVSQGAAPPLRQLFLQAGLQQCHIAYNEDHRPTLHHLLPLLKQECARSGARKDNPHLEFPLQWMQYQLSVLEEPESSLTNEQDRCLFAIEQARTVSNPCKRIPLLKAAFQHLPPLLRAEPRPDPAAPDVSPKRQGQAQPQRQQNSTALLASASMPVQRRSTVQLYKELLDLCMEEVSPSLYTVASVMADALRTLPRPPAGPTVDDLEEIQAVASLHCATLQCKQLEDEAATAAADTSTAFPECSSAQRLLAGLLKEAAQRGASLEARSTGSGGWIVANACITFLNMKQRAYNAGDYSTNMAELLELHSTYTALFAKGRVQDVSLLSDLTVAAVVGLLAGFVAAKAAAANPASPTHAAPSNTVPDATYTGLIRRIQCCTSVESSNSQLRKAEALCREAQQLIQNPKHKWFIAMLYPNVLRLFNEKPVVFLHPQEQLLIYLGMLSGPSLTLPERQSLLEQEMRPLLRRDPSVRLCAWVAAVAAEMHVEDAVMECYQLADALYASGRLGWDSSCDVQRSNTSTAAGGGVGGGGGKPLESSIISNGGGGGGVALGGILNGASTGNRKGSLSLVLVQQEPSNPVKPDADDWGAYAQLLAMKTQVCASHLQGLSGNVRRVALQQLLTNCVNSVIATIHGPASSKRTQFTRAFTSYYTILRDNNGMFPLAGAAFILPSLRMLLSKAILMQFPKREWNTTFTELVYQLGAILVYVSYSSGCDDNVLQLSNHLRLLRELLPPRYQKSLKVRETTEVCYKDPSVNGFLHVSRNMEVELQTHGWLIVAQRAEEEGSAMEAFALALSGTQANPFARAQCTFEFAFNSLEQGKAPLSRATDQLREALRILEGLPDSIPLLHDGTAGQVSLEATLIDKSLTASFLKTSRRRSQEEVSKAATLSGKAKPAATRASTRKSANAVNAPTVNFQHVFLGLRIVSLLFRVASPIAPFATGAGAAAVRANKSASMASRRDCANVMLDYISCLWELCGKVLREEKEAVAAAATPSSENDGGDGSDFCLPDSAAEYYGFVVAAGVAQQVRRLVPGEEVQLNTEGMWQPLLELGDYLISAGDEAHAFLVYSWLRFAAAMALGEPEGNAQCALVHRVCNLKMCLAATASGLSDEPYVAALRHLDEAHLPLDEYALVSSPQPNATSSLSVQPWLAMFVLAECEMRMVFGQTDEAAAMASKFLVAARKSAGKSFTDVELNGLRILALYDVVRARHDEALRVTNECLQSMRSHRDAFAPSSSFSVGTWIRLCGVKLRALLSMKAVDQAFQWMVAIREQLLEWRAAATAAAESSATLRALSLRVELCDAIQYWGKELLWTAESTVPSSTALPLFTTFEGPLHDAAVRMFGEVELLMEHGETVFCQLYSAAARWRLRDRVTPSWVAQHASSAEEHLCPRLTTLLAEMKALRQLSESLRGVGDSAADQRTTDDDDNGTRAATAATAATDIKSATSLSLWKAFLLYWSAVDRLEANRIVECLLGNFRRLSMTDLQLPTSDAPPHLEKEVLKFMRGVADDAAATTSRLVSGNVGARWQQTPTSAMTEVEQALQHYGLAVQEGKDIMDLSSVQPSLQTSLVLARAWSASRLAKVILITFAEIEVQRLTENQIAAADDMLGEKLVLQREAVLTAAWNRAPLVPPKTDKAGGRARKSVSAGKPRISNEASLMFVAPILSAEEMELLQRVKEGAEEAVQYMHLDIAEQLYDHLSNLAALLGRPRLAAAAAEQLQTCQLIGFLCAKSTQEMTDSVEGRLWRQLHTVHPLLCHATLCKALLDEVLAVSPMSKYIRNCALLCVEETKEEEVVPTNSHARDAAALTVSPFAIDAPVLTITYSSGHSDFCLVLLRHPDGGVEGRRKSVAAEEWHPLVQQFERMQSETPDLSDEPRSGKPGKAAQRVISEDVVDLTDHLAPVTMKLLMEFQPSLQSFGAKSPLYLCVAPGMQPIAWEQTSLLSTCALVVRELGAAVVVSKYNEPTHNTRQPPAHGSKTNGSGPSKGASTSVSVCIADVFGDHIESTENVLSAESLKSKNTQHTLITCSAPGSPPDPAYITWVLNASAPSSVVVDMCGSFTDALPLPYLAVLRLSQVNVAVLADGAVNAKSRQREERQQLDCCGVGFVPPRWVVQLLLLLRGARLVVANAFPCSPESADGLTRRFLSSLSSIKTLVEQLRGKGRDAKTPPVTLYGAFGSSSISSKQKS
ncbi:hypothetical protein ABB37_03583 [Leptomonas pyrrhocoris]|uniref:Uncharacterized protein n=1 Tax=Leptomonas pyrrhocoris TaxID=157538 RepID=A0A0N0DX40_LEPPY|nr:hypothetical protein ABB37_03583 [Leptomonas pyrrhocoris]KPA82545.1 hypothetical protein ABB37_03583 [Leptomonas pyrrhocoris]|eukprot:XP_015660984.1 hypothetical protein ABB37_03583 [Leptomonas pyrrhocoris]